MFSVSIEDLDVVLKELTLADPSDRNGRGGELVLIKVFFRQVLKNFSFSHVRGFESSPRGTP